MKLPVYLKKKKITIHFGRDLINQRFEWQQCVLVCFRSAPSSDFSWLFLQIMQSRQIVWPCANKSTAMKADSELWHHGGWKLVCSWLLWLATLLMHRLCCFLVCSFCCFTTVFCSLLATTPTWPPGRNLTWTLARTLAPPSLPPLDCVSEVPNVKAKLGLWLPAGPGRTWHCSKNTIIKKNKPTTKEWCDDGGAAQKETISSSFECKKLQLCCAFLGYQGPFHSLHQLVSPSSTLAATPPPSPPIGLPPVPPSL